MSHFNRLATAGLVAFGFTSAAFASASEHWSYGGHTGPGEWAALAEENRLCGIGQRQSPIDLRGSKAAPLADHDVAIRFGKATGKLLNNGHTIQMDVNESDGNAVTFKARDYPLAQFHFHTPSEHRLDGKSFPMEMHLVGKGDRGKLTVVGVFIKAGSQNHALAPLFANLPASNDAPRDAQIDLDALLPKGRKALLYTGSLTTPPCTESVNWVVLKEPIEMSRNQINAFRKLFRDNHRPIQPANGRMVVEESADLW